METLSELEALLVHNTTKLTYPYDETQFFRWLATARETYRICNAITEHYGREGELVVLRIERSLEGSSKGAFMMRQLLSDCDGMLQKLTQSLAMLDFSTMDQRTFNPDGNGGGRLTVN
jgi:hypothetical protein